MAKRPLAEIEWVTKLTFQLSEKFIDQNYAKSRLTWTNSTNGYVS